MNYILNYMKLDIYRGKIILVSVEIDNRTTFSHVGMGEYQIKASFVVPVNIDLMRGDYIYHKGVKFKINEGPEGKKANGVFYHDVIFEAPEYDLYDKKLKHEKQVEFSFFGTPHEHLALVINNILEIKVEPWRIGNVDEAEPKKLDYKDHSCRTAVTYIAQEFGMEYSFDGYAINLKKTVGRDTILTFEIGRGKGLYEIQRKKISDKQVYTRVTGYGGDKNIPPDYRGGVKKLMFDDNGAEYIDRNTDVYDIIEGSYTNSDIYPHRTGMISACSEEGTKNQSWWIEDADLPFDINNQLFEGIVAKLTFTSGDLAGNEIPFEITKYDPALKRIYFNATDDNGYILPNTYRKPAIGNKYIITDIKMPQENINEAEAQLKAETIEFTEKNCLWQFAYPVKPDPYYLKESHTELRVFDRVRIKDKDYHIDNMIRIVSLSYPLVDEYNVTFTVSEAIPYTPAERTLIQQAETSHQVKVMSKQQADEARFWAAQFNKMKGLIFDPDGKIQNAFVEAMAACFGSESQNFALSGVTVNANYVGDMTKLYITAGDLVHYTYKITGLPSPNYIWRMEKAVVFSDLDISKDYYVYAKCSKTALTGEWAVSNVPMMSNALDGYYCFNLGILFQVKEGETYRGFDFTKGNTLICGDQITTGLIQSLARNFIINLTEGTMFMQQGDSVIDVGYTQTGKIKLKGVVIVSGSGAEDIIGCDRGEYNSSYTYYEGDTVTYQGSTYKYVFGSHTKENLPTDKTYWRVIAQKGDTGNFTEYRYAKNGSTITPPDLNSSEILPLGWNDTMPDVKGGEYLWMISAKKGGDGKLMGTWSKPIRANGRDGVDGDDGKPGPGIVNMGEYSASKTYYGNDKSVVVVKYSGQYYISRVDAGSFTGIVPTNTSKWNSFGAQFESIATGLLLAEGANIANFVFRNGLLTSQYTTGGKYNLELDGKTGRVSFAAGKFRVDGSNVFMEGRISTPFEIITPPTGTNLFRDISAKDLILEYTNNPRQAKELIITGDVYDGMEFNLIINSKEAYVTDRIPIEVMGTTQWFDVPRQFIVSIQTGSNGKKYYVVCVQSSYAFVTFKWLSYLGMWVLMDEFYGIKPSQVVQPDK